MEATATIHIDRDQNEVFEYVSNPINMAQWVDGLSDIRLTSNGGVNKGTTFESKYTYGAGTYDMQFEVTYFDAPRRFGTKSEEGPFPFNALLVMQKDPKGTVIDSTIEVGADGVFTKVMFTLLGPLMRRSMRKQLLKELRVLKSRLEVS